MHLFEKMRRSPCEFTRSLIGLLDDRDPLDPCLQTGRDSLATLTTEQLRDLATAIMRTFWAHDPIDLPDDPPESERDAIALGGKMLAWANMTAAYGLQSAAPIPWLEHLPTFPGSPLILASIRSLRVELAQLDTQGSVDIRIQADGRESWRLLWGDVQYDTDHTGYWAASSIDIGDCADDQELADDLCRDLFDAYWSAA
jgi:hypothetical protein